MRYSKSIEADATIVIDGFKSNPPIHIGQVTHATSHCCRRPSCINDQATSSPHDKSCNRSRTSSSQLYGAQPRSFSHHMKNNHLFYWRRTQHKNLQRCTRANMASTDQNCTDSLRDLQPHFQYLHQLSNQSHLLFLLPSPPISERRAYLPPHDQADSDCCSLQFLPVAHWRSRQHTPLMRI